MLVSNTNLLLQLSIFRGELLVSGMIISRCIFTVPQKNILFMSDVPVKTGSFSHTQTSLLSAGSRNVMGHQRSCELELNKLVMTGHCMISIQKTHLLNCDPFGIQESLLAYKKSPKVFSANPNFYQKKRSTPEARKKTTKKKHGSFNHTCFHGGLGGCVAEPRSGSLFALYEYTTYIL